MDSEISLHLYTIIGEIYPALQTTMKILVDEIKGLFERQKCTFQYELDQERLRVTKLLEEISVKNDEIDRKTLELGKLQIKATSEVKALKEQHANEVVKLNLELKKKNAEIVSQLKTFIIQDIDLDEYNITSDDFRTVEKGTN